MAPRSLYGGRKALPGVPVHQEIGRSNGMVGPFAAFYVPAVRKLLRDERATRAFAEEESMARKPQNLEVVVTYLPRHYSASGLTASQGSSVASDLRRVAQEIRTSVCSLYCVALW